jgi:hypothetical protein
MFGLLSISQLAVFGARDSNCYGLSFETDALCNSSRMYRPWLLWELLGVLPYWDFMILACIVPALAAPVSDGIYLAPKPVDFPKQWSARTNWYNPYVRHNPNPFVADLDWTSTFYFDSDQFSSRIDYHEASTNKNFINYQVGFERYVYDVAENKCFSFYLAVGPMRIDLTSQLEFDGMDVYQSGTAKRAAYSWVQRDPQFPIFRILEDIETRLPVNFHGPSILKAPFGFGVAEFHDIKVGLDGFDRKALFTPPSICSKPVPKPKAKSRIPSYWESLMVWAPMQ